MREQVSPTDHIALEGLSEAGAEPQLQQQMQAQARQALRQQQRSNMVTPPDAAANFSPAVGMLALVCCSS